MDSNIGIGVPLYDQLEGLSDSSRIWVWQSPQELNQSQVERIQAVMGEFIPQWASHSRELSARSIVYLNRFVLVALDQEVSHAASGCSIDSLTHVITQLSAELNIDLLDRTHFCFKKEDIVSCIHMNVLSDRVSAGEIDNRSLVFNPLIASKKELLSKWLLPIGESWHKRFM
ncbi:MAG: hypothetical protein ACI9FN_002205 [Saprospiraceae bacterium]|jgi:hypothetical protein